MFKRFISFSAAEGIARALNWALAVGLPLYITPAEYGEIVFIMTTEILLVPLIVAGQSTTILRFHSRYSSNGMAFLTRVFATWIRIALGLAALALCTIWIFRTSSAIKNYAAPLTLLVLISPLLGMRDLLLAYYRVDARVNDYVRTRLLQQITKVSVVVLGVWLGFGSIAYVFGTAASVIVTLISEWRVVFSMVSMGLGNNCCCSIDRSLVGFGLPVAVYQFVAFLKTYADRYIIGFFIGTEQLGQYSLFYSFGSGLVLLMTITSISFLPVLYKEDGVTNRAEKLLALYADGILVVCAAISLGLSLALPYFVDRIYSSAYLGDQSVLVLILLGYLLQPLYLQAEYRLTLSGQTRVLPPMMVLMAGLNGALNLALVPSMGVRGAAMSLVLTNILSACVSAWYSQRISRVTQLNRKTLLVVVSSALMATVLTHVPWIKYFSLLTILVWSGFSFRNIARN